MRENQEFGTGIFSEITNMIYFFITTNVYFLIMIGLPIAWLLLLEPSLMNLIPLSLIGPNLTALGCCTLKYIEMDKRKEDIPNFLDYVGFLKKNFMDTLKIWVPYLIFLFILTISIEYYQKNDSTLGMGMSIILMGLLILSVLSMTYMILINAKFKFRARDLLRLSFYYGCKKIKMTLGILGIYFLTLMVLVFISDFLILLFMSAFFYVVICYSYEIVDDVNENFIQGKAQND